VNEAVVMTNDDLGSQIMDDMDPMILEFIQTKVNSFIKWDLVRFFHDNPHTTDTADNIARYTGRDGRVVMPELEQLVEAKVLDRTALSDMQVYTYTRSRETRQLITKFLKACDDRQFRVKALYHVIKGMA
jgi:hypothetical protein